MKLHTHVVQTLIKLYKKFKNPRPYRLQKYTFINKFLLYEISLFWEIYSIPTKNDLPKMRPL